MRVLQAKRESNQVFCVTNTAGIEGTKIQGKGNLSKVKAFSAPFPAPSKKSTFASFAAAQGQRQRKVTKHQLSAYTVKENTQESHNANRTKVGV